MGSVNEYRLRLGRSKAGICDVDAIVCSLTKSQGHNDVRLCYNFLLFILFNLIRKCKTCSGLVIEVMDYYPMNTRYDSHRDLYKSHSSVVPGRTLLWSSA